jgi:8-oxo-dGTP pyrophosphatase MutT (NUDIX family)
MNRDQLLAYLHSIPAPADVEEWLVKDRAFSPSSPAIIESDYGRAVRDVLAALGVLSVESGAVTSPTAYYFVQSLAYAIQDRALTPDSWRGLPDEGCTGAGARLVHLLEETRLACDSSATPLRVVRAVTAVIKARHGDQDVYLMQYDHKARQFQPLGGKQEAFDADGVAALTRELCEELNIASLTPGRDFAVHPLTQNVQVSEVSASVHVVTRYDHSFYHLTNIRFPLPIDTITRWLTSDEMATGHTTDGLAITSLFDDYLPGILPTLAYSV